jgi:TatD DNase family protein
LFFWLGGGRHEVTIDLCDVSWFLLLQVNGRLINIRALCLNASPNMTEQHHIIDIGANLGHRSFAPDRPQVVTRAFAAGVRTMIVTGSSLSSSREALQIAREYPGRLFSTAGVHPHDSRSCTDETLAELRGLAALDEVVAIGECGLDFFRNFSPQDMQEKWFATQVDLAEELQMPVFLHERDARTRFCEILAAHRRTTSAVLHCFTGSAEDLKGYLDMGLFIGITGWICDERRGTHLRELVRHIPADRLMIETDAPFLLPRSLPYKPKDGRNEPAFLAHVLETVAQCVGRPAAEVADRTTQNARAFFRL